MKFESHKEEINMAGVYWIAEDKLELISEALEVFRNHDRWKGKLV